MGSSDFSIYSNLVPKKFQGRSRGETLKHVQYASNQEYGSIKCIAERINLLWTYIQQNFSDNAIVQQGDQKWGLILQIISLSSCFWNWTWNQIIYACLWLKYVVLCFLLLLFMFYIPLFVFYVPLFVSMSPCLCFVSPSLCLSHLVCVWGEVGDSLLDRVLHLVPLLLVRAAKLILINNNYY